jgi:CheY-like chemotaxis protein
MYNRPPDLVLLDLVMPEMDGATLLRMIRGCDRWHELPVIVLTGAATDHVLIKAVKDLGIQDLVPKASFDFDDLLSRIKQHMPQAVA